MGIIQTFSQPAWRPLYSAGGGGGFAISNFSGTLTQGSTLTISGSGFTTLHNTPLFYDNFDSGTTGNNLASPWASDAGFNANYKYSTTNPLSGAKCARVDMVTGNPIGDWGNFLPLGSAVSKIFVEYASYVQIPTPGPGPEAPQIKYGRIFTGTDYANYSSPPPIFGITRFNPVNTVASDSVIVYESGAPYNAEWFADGALLSANAWHKITQFEDVGTTGAADGKRYFHIDDSGTATYSGYPGGNFNSLDGSVAASAYNGSLQIVRDTGVTGLPRSFILPFYTRTDQHVIMDIDTVWISDTEERVVLGNASTLSACTWRQIQPNTARSSTSITCTCEQADMPGAGNLWCIVVNDGGAETSYQVR